MLDLVLRGGEIVDPGGIHPGDLGIRDKPRDAASTP